MTEVLQIGNKTITASEIIPRLTTYQMLPQLVQEIIIDQAIAPFSCTPEEKASAQEQFYTQHQLTNEPARQAWCQRHDITPEQLEALTTRQLKIEKFKQANWGPKLPSYFLQRKSQLDRIIYSLLRTKDAGVVQELYFRLAEAEQSFAELAREYSQGPEAQTGGLIGPVELSTLPPVLARVLSISQSGQLRPPMPLGEWFVIVRQEKLVPAQLDESMGQRLLNELFSMWLQEQLQQQSAALID